MPNGDVRAIPNRDVVTVRLWETATTGQQHHASFEQIAALTQAKRKPTVTTTAELLSASSEGSYATDTVKTSVAFATTLGRLNKAPGAVTLSVRT